MKKIILAAIIAALVAMVLPVAVMMVSATKNTEAVAVADYDDNLVITYGYFKTLREELKQELKDELAGEILSSGEITVNTVYKDISLKEGEVLLLSSNCEIIYRGGGAVAITSSNNKKEGITDMSVEKEIFSGEELEYGHIYHASASISKKAILITGSSAHFTVRGDYEIA